MFKYIKNSYGRISKYGAGDKGECWSLPYNALEAASASLPCLTCGEAAKYVWGRFILEGEAKSGDVIQIDGKVEMLTKNGHKHRFKHHTMIIISKSGLEIKVAHQWVGSKVHYDDYNLWNQSGEGRMSYYRPQQALK